MANKSLGQIQSCGGLRGTDGRSNTLCLPFSPAEHRYLHRVQRQRACRATHMGEALRADSKGRARLWTDANTPSCAQMLLLTKYLAAVQRVQTKTNSLCSRGSFQPSPLVPLQPPGGCGGCGGRWRSCGVRLQTLPPKGTSVASTASRARTRWARTLHWKGPTACHA